jgi:hypothetical protein
MVPMVLICGLFQTLFCWFCDLFNLFYSIFLLSPADKFCSHEIFFKILVLCFCGAQWLRIARFKEYNGLGASCLKTEAKPISEMWCIGVYISTDDGRGARKRILYEYIVHHRQSLLEVNRILGHEWHEGAQSACDLGGNIYYHIAIR